MMNGNVLDAPLREDDTGIQDHLRNHVHLTNCIHLKNHMHKYSPVESLLMRELIVLQRSKSLRDPSTSPSWHSPFIGSSRKRYGKEGASQGGRRSFEAESRRDLRRSSINSSPIASVSNLGRSGGTDVEFPKDNGGGGNLDSWNEELRVREIGKPKGGECSRDNRVPQKGAHTGHQKQLIDHIRKRSLASEDVGSSRFVPHTRHGREEKIIEEEKTETSSRGQSKEKTRPGTSVNRNQKRKFRGGKRGRAPIVPRDSGDHHELSVASNSLAAQSGHAKYIAGFNRFGGVENVETEVTQDPRNVCGIPWNWSRIHHRGKTILDKAGRSLSCGISDSKQRKVDYPAPQEGPSSQRDDLNILGASACSSPSMREDSDALPLLVEPSGSHGSTETVIWGQNYSGELGIYGGSSMNRNEDSDLASEARSGHRCSSRGHHEAIQQLKHGTRERHRSLTQKYMPKTFKDVVGQNLVSQALLNAVIQRKIGFVYVFYGPHGTGKTSCARVFARALNCQSSDKFKPCGMCSSCIAHDMGKNASIREVGPIGNLEFESIMDLLESMVIPHHASQYRVFIVDDCDTLPGDSWVALSKAIDRAPRRIVFILISTTLDHLPHNIISRCQKFLFPKLKDADIVSTLQWIAIQEELEVDKDALKLIASRSDGSLRDAEMTLDQLSLLGQRISVRLFQELVGLISEEKLVDLLDLALSADTVNTVKSIRELMEAGVEPLALMSQLATIITDILVGSYTFTKERLRRKFFRRPTLSKEEMERLRQALKTLSEAEKQLRVSNDRVTWLTAALLQLAPDQQYVLPSSSGETSFSHSPMRQHQTSERDLSGRPDRSHAVVTHNGRGLTPNGGKMHVGMDGGRSGFSTDITKVSGGQFPGNGSGKGTREIWESALEKIQSNTLKQFMVREGKLVSVSFGAAPTAQLVFSSHVNKAKAEKLRMYILQAFEAVLGSPVTIEIRCEPKKDIASYTEIPLGLSPLGNNSAGQLVLRPELSSGNRISKPEQLSKERVGEGTSSSQIGKLHSSYPENLNSRNEIVELVSTPRRTEDKALTEDLGKLDDKRLEIAWVQEEILNSQSSFDPCLRERKRTTGQPQNQSLVRGRVSLAHVIQQAEGTGWSKRKGVSIAEKLEQDNLRLEPSSRSLLCWKTSRVKRGKLPHLRHRTRGSRLLRRLAPCARCPCPRSPR
ncbi:protein STICHEL-like 4 isoform X1 [Amborella trichopoda]|uniref:protein STICHEL-like 4 isoform X1 n=2 Tax=Amborella trichopoda TaxID=13333 RepID=UPI0009BF3FF3|nr:protein STICHEL-like 4 isoform X1 [Amborella trichopoda]|eukprot:XP_011629383.2 protein STICHEL-like 4 isoform X1 [Amborella trichopoda]